MEYKYKLNINKYIAMLSLSLFSSISYSSTDSNINEFSTNYIVETGVFFNSSVKVNHRLKKIDETKYLSEISGSAFFNTFKINEKSYFKVDNNKTKPYYYTSYYKTPVKSNNYKLTIEDLDRNIDRQNLFFRLSDLIIKNKCMKEKCSIDYYDHKKRLKTFEFSIAKKDTILYNEKEIDFYLIVGNQSDHELRLSLHPNHQGMLLFMDVEGKSFLYNENIKLNDIKPYLINQEGD